MLAEINGVNIDGYAEKIKVIKTKAALIERLTYLANAEMPLRFKRARKSMIDDLTSRKE